MDFAREDDGRWLAIIRELPGVMAYGQTQLEAAAVARRIATGVLADRVRHGEQLPPSVGIPSVA
jgi:predicted RNase H-like HicB family nuclease